METKSDIRDIDRYIRTFPEPVQVILLEIRKTIQAAAPEASETIAYGIPTFKLHGNLVHFAAHKHHIGFYPAPQGLEAFKEELSKYKGSKGTVQFPLDQPLPLKLISRIVKYRVTANLEKAEAKKKKKG